MRRHTGIYQHRSCGTDYNFEIRFRLTILFWSVGWGDICLYAILLAGGFNFAELRASVSKDHPDYFAILVIHIFDPLYLFGGDLVFGVCCKNPSHARICVG